MKWVHRRAINILRPPSWTIFHARNHGTILFVKLCHLRPKKHVFSKIKKKCQKKIGGSGGQSPPAGLKGSLSRSISFQIMSKPFQSCLNLSKHVKNIQNQIPKSKNWKKIINFQKSFVWKPYGGKSGSLNPILIVSRPDFKVLGQNLRKFSF